MIGNDILRETLLKQQTGSIASTFRKFWETMQLEDEDHLLSTIARNTKDDTVLLIAFWRVWQKLKNVPLAKTIDTMLLDGTRLQLIPEQTTLNVLYQTIFPDRALWLKELVGDQSNSEKLQKSFVLFIGVLNSTQSHDRMIAFETLARIPQLIL